MQCDESTVFRKKSQKLIDIYKYPRIANRFFPMFGRFLVQMPYHAGMNGI